MDNFDKMILRHLQDNAKMSTAELGRKIKLSTTATKERIKKLEDEGIIEGYTARINADKIGHSMIAFITIPVGDISIAEMGKRLMSLSEIQECHKVTGNTCFLVKAKVKSPAHLERLVDYINQFAKNTYTYLVLSTIKETSNLEID